MKLTNLKGISTQRERLFQRINIYNIGDLISYFPRKYKDFSKCQTLASSLLLQEKEEIMVKATIIGFERVPTRNRRSFLKIKIQDESANATLVAFNQDYLQKSLKINEEYMIIGIFTFEYNQIQSSSFQIEKSDSQSLHVGRIVPFYPLTEGITQKIMRESIFQSLNLLKSALKKENLPPSLIQKQHLISRKESLFNIHFPQSFDLLEGAKKRIKYFELFKLQYPLALKKQLFKKTKNREYPQSLVLKQFKKTLPFELTKGQEKAVKDILADLSSSTPMHRLLQGDVGSGKTLVALLSLIKVCENGYQGVLMVPTEVLAQQHFIKISQMLSSTSIKVGLLTSSVKGKERLEILKAIANSDIQLVIGTHSLLIEEVVYKNLALAVIDEQHKFGVLQRAALVSKGQNPDILVMTATPIPRTLGITIFGDMDISVILEKPVGRKKIITQWVYEHKMQKVFDKIKEEVRAGHQGYVVYPLIEDSEKLDLKSALSMFEELQAVLLPGISMGLMHGRMNEDEKERVMKNFVLGNISVLVSTTVIEVGVDVPNATFILIENAHRFGLSTLHQLRGRIGRNNFESTCFLSTPKNLTFEAKERMKAMEESDDGFYLSQKDLEIRGTGEFLGTKQKGVNELKLASLIYDGDLLDKARQDAFNMVIEDPHVKKAENLCLKPWYDEFCKTFHTLLRT